MLSTNFVTNALIYVRVQNESECRRTSIIKSLKTNSEYEIDDEK